MNVTRWVLAPLVALAGIGLLVVTVTSWLPCLTSTDACLAAMDEGAALVLALLLWPGPIIVAIVALVAAPTGGAASSRSSCWSC